jgi:shikimate 5-dehydrogenase
MNEANQITAKTKLYGFIAEKAQSDRFSATLNQKFKAAGDDAMIIPMNIRPDDIYFTVSNLRNAQLDGVAIAPEYRHDVMELLDGRSGEVTACGFCDLLLIREGRLIGEIAIGRALSRLMKEKGIETLGILGSGALAKALLWHIEESDVQKVVLFNDRIESCLELTQNLGDRAQNITFDIERVIDKIPANFSGCDAAVNASAIKNAGEMPIASASLMIDLEHGSSLFKAAATGEYMGYNDVLPYLTESVYVVWMKENK